MYLLEKGKMYALFGKAKNKGGWIGRTACYLADSDHIPFSINEKKFLLEFVLPEHSRLLIVPPNSGCGGHEEHCEEGCSCNSDGGLRNSSDFQQPKVFHCDEDKQFIPQRDYRIIRMYEVTDEGEVESNLWSDEYKLDMDVTLLVSVLRQVVTQYVVENMHIHQFFYTANGKLDAIYKKALDNKIKDDVSNRFETEKIDELQPPVYGFEIKSKFNKLVDNNPLK